MRRVILNCGWAIVLVASQAAAGPLAAPDDKPAVQRPRDAIERWNQMSPEERERELAKLPPERARQIREGIRRYNQLPPAEKQRLREGYQRFSQLAPEKQEIVRQSLRDFRQLSPDRRPLVRREIAQIRALPRAQRGERMNSDEFRSQFSPQEQNIIRGITENLTNEFK